MRLDAGSDGAGVSSAAAFNPTQVRRRSGIRDAGLEDGVVQMLHVSGFPGRLAGDGGNLAIHPEKCTNPDNRRSTTVMMRHCMRPAVPGAIPASPVAPIVVMPVPVPMISAYHRPGRSAYCSASATANHSADDRARCGAAADLGGAFSDRHRRANADEQQECQQVLHLRIFLFRVLMKMSPDGESTQDSTQEQQCPMTGARPPELLVQYTQAHGRSQ